MKLKRPPELADGGYWYVMSTNEDLDVVDQASAEFMSSGYCSWVLGTFGIVRSPVPVAGINALPSRVSEVLTGPKPYGRVEGQ